MFFFPSLEALQLCLAPPLQRCLYSRLEPRVVLCQLPPRVPVKHSLSRDTRPTQQAALGTNQAENPLIPVVTVRHGMLAPWKTLGGVSGGEEASSGDAARRLEDFRSRRCMTGEQSRAVIRELHNDCLCVIHRD